MKAICVDQTGGPEVLQLKDMDIPEVGVGGVLVKVFAAGVNPVETYIRSGSYGPVNLPYTPGTDAAGIVEKVGSGVEGFKPGDRVYVAGSQTGTYAEYVLCQQITVYPLPEDVTFRQGACVGVPYATAYQALVHRACARPGNRVLIHGASGGVGTAAVQLAKSLGMIVTGTAGTPDGMKLVKDQGADFVFNHREDGYSDKAYAATGENGFDVIIEMLANVNLDRDLDLLAHGGRVVVVGSRGRIEIDPRKTMKKDTSILGMTLVNASEEEKDAIHAALGAGLRNGTLHPVVERAFPLGDASRAHEAVMQDGAYGHIVLVGDWA